MATGTTYEARQSMSVTSCYRPCRAWVNPYLPRFGPISAVALPFGAQTQPGRLIAGMVQQSVTSASPSTPSAFGALASGRFRTVHGFGPSARSLRGSVQCRIAGRGSRPSRPVLCRTGLPGGRRNPSRAHAQQGTGSERARRTSRRSRRLTAGAARPSYQL